MHSREQGGSKFSSIQERDAFLQKEIQGLEWTLQETNASMQNILEERKKVEDAQSTLKEDETKLIKEIRILSEHISSTLIFAKRY